MDVFPNIEKTIVQHFVLDASDNSHYSRDQILDTINHLIQNDLEKLLFILYRVDVAEDKIRTALLLRLEDDAAEIIYLHIYEREMEKVLARKKYNTAHKSSEEEKW